MADINVYLDKFQGVNNLLDPKDLTSNELTQAINVDITRDGRIQSRPSWKYIRECEDGHSLWSDNINMYFVDGDNLIKKNPNGVEQIIDIGYKGLKTSFLKDVNNIIISNDKFIKRFKNNKIYDIAPPTCTNEYDINFGLGGTFPIGKYQIAITYLFDDGIEGATRNAMQVEITQDNSSIVISNLPVTFDSNITGYRLYLTEQNATTLRHYNDYGLVDSITLNYNIQNFGKQLQFFNKDPISPGSLIEKYKGVIFTAVGNKIYFSEPLEYLTKYNYLEFDGDITLLVAHIDGIYVSDSYNVYWLSGSNPHDLNRIQVYNSPAIKYTQNKNIMTNDVFFYTQTGQIIAESGGQIKNITEDKHLPNKELKEGASLIMYQNGIKKIINSFKTGESNSAGFGDWAKICD